MDKSENTNSNIPPTCRRVGIMKLEFTLKTKRLLNLEVKIVGDKRPKKGLKDISSPMNLMSGQARYENVMEDEESTAMEDVSSKE